MEVKKVVDSNEDKIVYEEQAIEADELKKVEKTERLEAVEEGNTSDEKAIHIVSSLNSGITREELAEEYNYKSWKSIDMYMRRKGYTWDIDKKTYYLKPEPSEEGTEYSATELPANSKIRMIVNYFRSENTDPKTLADRMGFKSHLSMAQYMKDSGYLWSSEKRNYYRSSKLKIKNTEDPMILADYYKEHTIKSTHIETSEQDIQPFINGMVFTYADSKDKSTNTSSEDILNEMGVMRTVGKSTISEQTHATASHSLPKLHTIYAENVYINNVKHRQMGINETENRLDIMDNENNDKKNKFDRFDKYNREYDVNIDNNSGVTRYDERLEAYTKALEKYEQYLPMLELLDKNKSIIESIVKDNEDLKEQANKNVRITDRTEFAQQLEPLDIPELLLDKASSYCKQNNISFSMLIEKAISSYLE